MINNKSSTPVIDKQSDRKSRKYTWVLTGCFVFIFAVVLMALMVPWAADVQQVDASFATKVDQFMFENTQLFLVWRLFIYAVFISIFYHFLKKRLGLKGDLQAVRRYTVRLVAYMIIFELFVVQNVLNKAMNLFIL